MFLGEVSSVPGDHVSAGPLLMPVSSSAVYKDRCAEGHPQL